MDKDLQAVLDREQKQAEFDARMERDREALRKKCHNPLNEGTSTIIHCSQESYLAFYKLGRATKARKEWQLALELETLSPTPITHKIIEMEIKIELYEVMISLALLRIARIPESYTFSKDPDLRELEEEEAKRAEFELSCLERIEERKIQFSYVEVSA